MGENVDRDSVASHCYALTRYRPPDQFTAIEAATFDHGAHAERIEVLKAVCMRSAGVPEEIRLFCDCNYMNKGSVCTQCNRIVCG